MTDAIRTPDELLEGLPDFPFEPHCREFDGLRLAHIDEGEGAAGRVPARRADLVVPVAPGDPAGPRRGLPLHRPRPARVRALRQADRASTGTATTAIPRAIAPLLDELDLRDATVVVHDWGGPIGLRLAVEHPDRIAPAGDPRHRTVHRPPEDDRRLDRVSRLRRRGPRTCRSASSCAAPASATRATTVIAAYEAPVPERRLEGRRASVPADAAHHPDAPGAAAGSAGARGAARGPAAEADPVGRLRPGVAARDRASGSRPRSGSEIAHVIADASHFLQEDAGPQIGALIADWLG